MDNEDLMTAEQAAERLGVSSRTVRRRLERAGKGRRAGRVWLLSDSDLEAITSRILPEKAKPKPLRLSR